MLKQLVIVFAFGAMMAQAIPAYAPAPAIVKAAPIVAAAPAKIVAAPIGYAASAIGGVGLGAGVLVGPAIAGPAPVVSAAIHSKHHIHHYDVPSTGIAQPTTVEVAANQVPINILFRSASSALNVQQLHEGAPGSSQESASEDEPHRLVHSVVKPVLQEVREVIVPMRRITQEITPVQEEIQTLVARGSPAPAIAAAGPIIAPAGAGIGGSIIAPASAPASIIAPAAAPIIAPIAAPAPIVSAAPAVIEEAAIIKSAPYAAAKYAPATYIKKY